jgi:hypothetical protein
MRTYGMNYWQMRDGLTINAAIKDLPIAESKDVFWLQGNPQDQASMVHDAKHKAIVVNGKVVDIPSSRYVLTQHEKAFRPIIEGLTVSGVRDFNYMMWANERRANMAILVGEAEDGVKYGFRVKNSFDRTTTINFSFEANQLQKSVEIVEKEHVLVWGIRQACTNGAIIRVPLKTCKYLDAELVTKVKNLMSQFRAITHIGNVDSKLKDMQYIVEAFMLLKAPLNMMIIDAQNHKLDMDQAAKLVEKYVGRRRQDEILELFGREERTLWGLVNSITFLASHSSGKLSMNMREGLVDKAGLLMEEELLAESQ